MVYPAHKGVYIGVDGIVYCLHGGGGIYCCLVLNTGLKTYSEQPVPQHKQTFFVLDLELAMGLRLFIFVFLILSFTVRFRNYFARWLICMNNFVCFCTYLLPK